MRIRFVLALITISTISFGQVNISQISISAGNHFAKTNDFDSFFNLYVTNPDLLGLLYDPLPVLDGINGMTTAEVSGSFTQDRFQKISLNVSIGFAFQKKRQESYTTFSTYNGMILQNGAPVPGIAGEVICNYSYQFKNYSLGITPRYKLMDSKRFFIEAAVGAALVFTQLDQDGLGVHATTNVWMNLAVADSFKKWSVKGVGELLAGVKINESHKLALGLRYNYLKIKKIGPVSLKENGFIEDEVTKLYPVTKSNYNFSGFEPRVMYIYAF